MQSNSFLFFFSFFPADHKVQFDLSWAESAKRDKRAAVTFTFLCFLLLCGSAGRLVNFFPLKWDFCFLLFQIYFRSACSGGSGWWIFLFFIFLLLFSSNQPQWLPVRWGKKMFLEGLSTVRGCRTFTSVNFRIQGLAMKNKWQQWHGCCTAVGLTQRCFALWIFRVELQSHMEE